MCKNHSRIASKTQISQSCFHRSINCFPWTPSVCSWINWACHEHAQVTFCLKGNSWLENMRISAANINLDTPRPSFSSFHALAPEPSWYSCMRSLSKSHRWNDYKLCLQKYLFSFTWLISMMWFLIWGHPCHPKWRRRIYMNDRWSDRSFTRFATKGHKNYNFAINSSKEFSIL